MKIIFKIPTLTHDGLKALSFFVGFYHFKCAYLPQNRKIFFFDAYILQSLSGSESQAVDILPCSSTAKTKQARNKAHQC